MHKKHGTVVEIVDTQIQVLTTPGWRSLLLDCSAKNCIVQFSNGAIYSTANENDESEDTYCLCSPYEIFHSTLFANTIYYLQPNTDDTDQFNAKGR